MIDLLINEFIAIVKHLKKADNTTIQREYIIAKKEQIVKLLVQYDYETPEKKLQYWRRLHWIDTDQGRLTKRISVDGKVMPAIKISLEVYKILYELAEKE